MCDDEPFHSFILTGDKMSNQVKIFDTSTTVQWAMGTKIPNLATTQVFDWCAHRNFLSKNLGHVADYLGRKSNILFENGMAPATFK